MTLSIIHLCENRQALETPYNLNTQSYRKVESSSERYTPVFGHKKSFMFTWIVFIY